MSGPEELRALVEEMRAALQWMVNNDETNEGDVPIPEHHGQTWNEVNAYWIAGLNRARAALTRAESSLASPAGMDGWMPIETAPKDGTPILVYFTRPSLGVQRVFFGDLDGDPVGPGEDGMWLINDNKHGPYPLRGYSEGDDSHWMPLPAAPRGESE